MGSSGVLENDDYCTARWKCHLVRVAEAANSLSALLLRHQLMITWILPQKTARMQQEFCSVQCPALSFKLPHCTVFT